MSWMRDEKVSVDKSGFLWWWEGQGGVRANDRGLEGGMGQGCLLCLLDYGIVVG